MRIAAAVTAAVLAVASPATAATLRGFVFDDTNRDGLPNPGESGVANAVVALGAKHFSTTDADGQFTLVVPDGARGIAWVRVPDGFVPGPVWARVNLTADDTVDLALRRLPAGPRGAVTFVVAADTHITATQEYVTAADLAHAASMATALDPAPAFFTILGDITQGNRDEEFALVDAAVGDLGVPYVPVPGNHDWYDGGAAWFRHYGPDNYSFDIGTNHFVVWNMAMNLDDLRRYLGDELSRVAPDMTIVALTHAPPGLAVLETLRELGVDYVLTGHAHSNRVVEHDGVIELNTQPMLMGGLDFTPAGYRVLTLDAGRLDSYHRTTLDEPYLSITSPGPGTCVPLAGARVLVAAELDGAAANVTAQLDCSTPVSLRHTGGWTHEVALPPLSIGPHTLTVEATSVTGTRTTATRLFEACAFVPPPPPPGPSWPQLGGGPTHTGARARPIAPPLVERWTTSVGGHVVTAPPLIADGNVYVAVSDLGDGTTGGVVALDLATGAQRWRVATPRTIRGGIAIAAGSVAATLVDGSVVGLDARTGATRWRTELSTGLPPEAGALYSPPSADGDEIVVGHQRAIAAIDARAGEMMWSDEPVPDGLDSQSAAAIAIGEGIAIGTFNRILGGVIAWDRVSGERLWQSVGAHTVAINASPVMDSEHVYVVSGADDVTALRLDGRPRWRVRLDSAGFDWGNATIGTPALAGNTLVVPTLYRDLVALDTATGAERWRFSAVAGPLRTTHYRGGREAGFAASPVITGDIVWAVDTAGVLTALELGSGRPLWQTALGVPAIAGLAVSGDWLVAATYDGTVRALVPTSQLRIVTTQPACSEPPPDAGCCSTSGAPSSLLVAGVAAGLLRRRRRQARARNQ